MSIPPNQPPNTPFPPESSFATLLEMLNPDQIKRAVKYGLRAMSEPCGMPACKAVSPGPACSSCNQPTCLDHTYFRASAPTVPMCPTCITGEHLAVLAQEGLLDEEDEVEPAPARRKPAKKKAAPRKK